MSVWQQRASPLTQAGTAPYAKLSEESVVCVFLPSIPACLALGLPHQTDLHPLDSKYTCTSEQPLLGGPGRGREKAWH